MQSVRHGDDPERLAVAHVQRIDPDKTTRLVRVRYCDSGAEAIKPEDEAAVLEAAGLVTVVMQAAAIGNRNVER